MNCSILICTHGDPGWHDLAWSRAYPSTLEQGAFEVLCEHDDDATLAEIRNRAASLARGDWLCFLDADDELAPGFLAEMGHAMAALDFWNEESLLAPALQRVAGGRCGRAGIPNLGRWPDANECCIGTLLPRWLFGELGGFRELPSLEDYDLFLRAAKAGARIVHVPAAVYRAYARPGSRNADQGVYARLRAEHAEVWAR